MRDTIAIIIPIGPVRAAQNALNPNAALPAVRFTAFILVEVPVRITQKDFKA
jgi:hypothetical protein